MQCLRAVNWLLLSSATDIFLPHTHTESLTQGHFNTNVTTSNRPAELQLRQKPPQNTKQQSAGFEPYCLFVCVTLTPFDYLLPC